MKFILYFTDNSEKVVIAISFARIYVNNVAPISVDVCLVHSNKLRTLMHSMRICSKYGINWELMFSYTTTHLLTWSVPQIFILHLQQSIDLGGGLVSARGLICHGIWPRQGYVIPAGPE